LIKIRNGKKEVDESRNITSKWTYLATSTAIFIRRCHVKADP